MIKKSQKFTECPKQAKGNGRRFKHPDVPKLPNKEEKK